MNWMLRATGKQVMNYLLKQFNPITVLAMVLAGTFAFVVGKQQAPDPNEQYLAEIAQWKTEALNSSRRLDSALMLVKDMRAINASLQAENQDKLIQAATLKASATKTRKELDRVRDSVKTSTVAVECEPLVQLADGYRAESDSLRKALTITESVVTNKDIEIGNLNIALKSLEEKATDLQTKVTQFPPDTSKKKILGFIPRPSRVVSFLGGVIVTLGGVVAVASM